MTSLEQDAIAALAAKGDAERQLAAAAYCPPWRHWVFGLLMAGFVFSPAIAMPLRLVLLAGLLGAIPLIVASDRKRMGMFINGYRRGRTLLVTLPLVAINLLLYAASAFQARITGGVEWPIILAGIALLVSTVGSILWQRVFVRELGA